ncbi:MAG: aminotransferase class I/II-fold pyridoxal phosphate-dependent enzyme, partial [Victivallales bacterium]|nr:aminotransferase class I/II-fold pyridoxal phosphate-dependent enzyme [Victivallales bacterium]
MNPLAQELNRQIAAVNPHVLDMLSERGKRFYFPKGILSQSAEAKSLATKFNATIGTALEDGHAMALPSLMEELPGIDANSALLYAPSPGNPKLREAWRIKTLHDNPSLSGHPVSLPIVTNGLSHGLSLLADMFVNPDDPLIYPDMNWGNYALNFVVRSEAVPCYYKFFKNNGF